MVRLVKLSPYSTDMCSLNILQKYYSTFKKSTIKRENQLKAITNRNWQPKHKVGVRKHGESRRKKK